MNVLLVGDDCIDEYVYGTVDRLSPEAPIPILNMKRKEQKPGMAGNVQQNLLVLGCKVTSIVPETKCIKTRYVDDKSNYQLLRVDTDYNLKKEPVNLPDLNLFDAIVISDYNKGFVTWDLIDVLSDQFYGPVFLDSKKRDLGGLNTNVIVKINEKESKECTTLPLSTNLIVTKGARGAEFAGKLYPAPPTDVYDVTGAGDTFLAALTFEFLQTKSIPKAIEYANKVAAITVRHYGCYVPNKHDLKDVRELI
jgi:D-beta-D-heptose 7-phosphate kinase/D-beta-D-heptose 1-phosphate adenosyltransferase